MYIPIEIFPKEINVRLWYTFICAKCPKFSSSRENKLPFKLVKVKSIKKQIKSNKINKLIKDFHYLEDPMHLISNSNLDFLKRIRRFFCYFFSNFLSKNLK
uniref:Uncharacterized protein n=1 Tax=Lutzomyia longipalpis TaxID=7200 RepID=A0A1B0CI59_LUTLO